MKFCLPLLSKIKSGIFVLLFNDIFACVQCQMGVTYMGPCFKAYYGVAFHKTEVVLDALVPSGTGILCLSLM